MVATIKDLSTYTECIRATNELHLISKQLEQFADWYCQDFFEDFTYDVYIDESCKKLNEFATLFHQLADEQLKKEVSD